LAACKHSSIDQRMPATRIRVAHRHRGGGETPVERQFAGAAVAADEQLPVPAVAVDADPGP
jgi:hypothetical protein